MSLDNEFFRALAEETADHILITDPDGTILYVNSAFETVTGYSREEVLGKTPCILKSGKHEQSFYENLWQTVLSGEMFQGNFINKKKDGSFYTEEKTITPIKDTDGQITHLISTGKDVTEWVEEDTREKRAQIRLRQKISQALVASQSPYEVINILVEKSTYYPKAAVTFFTLKESGDTAVLELRKANLAESGLAPLPMGTQFASDQLHELFSSERSFVTDDIIADERVSPEAKEMANQVGAVSLAAFPLAAGGGWLGALIFASSEPAYFTEEHLAVYRDLVEQGALALRAAWLNEEARAALVRREREVALTTQVAQEIASAANLHDLYERVVFQVQEQFGYYYTQLLRYDDTMDILALVVGYGDAGQQMLDMNHSMPMGVGLIGQAAATRQSVLRGQVIDDPNWQSNALLPETRSELAVPIKLRDEVLGVLDVQSDKVDGVTANDQLLLEGLCGQIAIAIESTELRQEMEGRLRELSLLQRQMSQEGWRTYQQMRREKLGYRFDLSGLQTLTNEQDTPVQGSKNGASAQLPIKPQLSKPLTVRGEAIGRFGVEDDPERPLTDEERDIIDAVAEELAEALEAARLFEQTQIALAEQERLASELETVAQVSTAASTILEADELLQSVVDLAKSSFGLYHAHIYLTNETGTKLVLKAGAGNIGRLMSLEGREINLNDESIVARAARTRNGVLENNVRRTVDFLPHPLLPETRSEMALPMMVGSKLIGVLDLQSDREGFFSEEDLNVQTTLAAQISVAVENANQYAAQVQTATKLREVDQLKSEFLASMSHELRTPLNSIIGFADVLLEGLDGELNGRMEEDVRLIRESGDHLRGLIGDILDMSKIEAGHMDLRYEEIDMAQLTHDVVATVAPLAQEKQIFLHLDVDETLQPIQGDRTRLRQVLWNIVGNAIKFTDSGSVTVSVQAQPKHMLCSVRDTGVGIKEEHAAVVFEQFRQIDGGLNRSVGGTGLGMPITKKLVELHGGEIWLESVYGQGTTFLFTIPYRSPKMKLKQADAVKGSS